MSIRIGDTVYLTGMAPMECGPLPAGWPLMSCPIEAAESTLEDLLAARPGGIVRIKRQDADTSWMGG